MTRPSVWVLVHDLERTGVPIALARMATWPGARAALDLRVVARSGGPVEAELSRAGTEVVVLEPPGRRSPASTAAVAAAQLGRPSPGAALRDRWWRRRVRHLPPPDLVLVHGAGALAVAAALGPTVAGAELVVHLHELDTGVDRSADAAGLAQLRRATRVLAVSEPVGELAVRLGVGADRIALVPGAVDEPPGGWDARPVRPAEGFPIVSIGEAGWRKGTDRAEAAAHELRRRLPHARWHWIGADPAPGWAHAVGTASPLIGHAPRPDPWSAVSTPAVAVIPSREDPLPLVALEAGARALPVVATATGGLPALLAAGRGTVVAQAALEELADAVVAVHDDPDAARGAGERLRAHVRAHHDLAVVGPAWVAALTGR